MARGADGLRAPTVYENGLRIPDAERENLGASKAIVLAVDRSKSMHGRPLEQAATAADRFLLRKRRSDVAAVVTFGSTALMQTAFRQSTIDGDDALRGLSTDQAEGTALYDAIVLSAVSMRRQTLPGRVLVLLTDGRDVRSVATLDDALRAVRRANVVVYTIALGDADRKPLKRLARASGGSFYATATGATLDAIYRRVGAELDRTWRISYATAVRPGQRISLALGTRKGPSGHAMSVVVPGSSSAPSSGRLARVLLHGPAGLLLLISVVALLFYLSVRAYRQTPQVEHFKRLVAAHTELERRPLRQDGPHQRIRVLLAVLDRYLRGLHRWGRIEQLVERAAVPVSASTVLAAGLVLAFVLSLIVALAGASSFVVVMLFLAGVAAPIVAVGARARQRVSMFDQQLPDVLATVASSLRAGHALKHALNGIAQEAAPPAGSEFKRVLAEARLGRPLEEALVAMCERLGSDDLLYVASAVDVQSQVGGSLSGVFGTVAETVRQRQQHRRRVRALTGTGRATATVLAALPFALAALLALVSPDYMLPFLRSGFGHMMIVVSLVSISIGALLLNRIVNVKG